MAMRVAGATTSYLSRSASLLDYNSPYTLMAWVRPEVVTGTQNIFVLSHLTSTTYDSLSMASGVLSIAAANGSFPSGTSGSTLTAATWAHVALVRVAQNDLRLYLNGVLDATHTTSTTSRAALNRMLLGIWQSGGFSASDPYNGRYACIKAWSTNLSAAEIGQEINTIAPRRATGLYGWWPTFPGSSERTRDYGGSAADWTENGTITDEDPPPVSYGAPIQLIGLARRSLPLLPFYQPRMPYALLAR